MEMKKVTGEHYTKKFAYIPKLLFNCVTSHKLHYRTQGDRMKPSVHPTVWIGLAINFVVLLGALYYMNETYIFDNVTLVFSLIFAAAFVMSLIGVLMLAAGNAAGGIVGIIGSAVYVPIGLICVIGCAITRQRIKLADFQQSGLASQPGNTPERASAPSPAHAPDRPAPHNQPVPDIPLATFPFADYRWMACLLIGAGIAGFLFVVSQDKDGGRLIAPIGIGILMLMLQQRQQKAKVFALYDTYLECLPDPWSPEVKIPYASITEAVMHKRKAEIMVRTSGVKAQKIKIIFSNIAGDLRDEAKHSLAQKMRELGVLTDKT